jgi:hypothetical protein
MKRRNRMKKLIFTLTRQAKKGGGDRYEHGKEGDSDFMVIYIPQFISRSTGAPRTKIEVSFD